MFFLEISGTLLGINESYASYEDFAMRNFQRVQKPRQRIDNFRGPFADHSYAKKQILSKIFKAKEQAKRDVYVQMGN